MNKEYEYSFYVKEIEPYIQYCEKNDYKKTSEGNQIRELYKNGNKILARITKNYTKGNEKIFFDLKDENETEDTLKICRESGEIEVTNNMEFVNSLLEMLKFKLHKKLTRKRYVYEKDNVKFEIDDYKVPKAKVVAIEGDKLEVDEVYSEIKNRNFFR